MCNHYSRWCHVLLCVSRLPHMTISFDVVLSLLVARRAPTRRAITVDMTASCTIRRVQSIGVHVDGRIGFNHRRLDARHRAQHRALGPTLVAPCGWRRSTRHTVGLLGALRDVLAVRSRRFVLACSSASLALRRAGATPFDIYRFDINCNKQSTRRRRLRYSVGARCARERGGRARSICTTTRAHFVILNE